MTNPEFPTGEALPNWQPAQRPPADPMRGHSCVLVPTVPDEHAAALFEAFALDRDHKNWTYLPYGPFDELAVFKEWMEEASGGSDPFFHTIIERESQRPVGLASYLRIEPTTGVIEVGHLHFAPSLQRTVAATEAMFLMMKRVFDELGYRRYEWKCDALNAPSRRAAERLGFQFEGVFRQATIYKGRNRDTAWYAVIDKDWPGLRAAFKEWLDPANFDSDGKQKQRLESFRSSE